VYVVDAADFDNLATATRELHALLEKTSLGSVPLLVLGNKNDLPGALGTQELIDRMNLQVCVGGGTVALQGLPVDQQEQPVALLARGRRRCLLLAALRAVELSAPDALLLWWPIARGMPACGHAVLAGRQAGRQTCCTDTALLAACRASRTGARCACTASPARSSAT
jgi:hypothetical protein